VTALAGTPVTEVAAALAEHDQYLPFDPLLAAAGATLGGAVAAGASGSNALRHGGVRDFVIGVRFIDGTGRLMTGGGKVVKNAAGFDLPKLMVGSRGRLGVLVELSFKVFPRPRATATLAAETGSTEAALAAMAALRRMPVELDALDIETPGRLLVRLGGPPETLEGRVARVTAALPSPVERLEPEADDAEWRRAAELGWAPQGSSVIKVGVTARHVPALEAALAPAAAVARYGLAANVAWVAWPSERPLDGLDVALRELGIAGIALTGTPGRTLLGRGGGDAFATRIRTAIDPHGRFLEL
jgi:glycolate oxidase FAD binding subunit